MKAGALVIVDGPSGSGKDTLLSALAGKAIVEGRETRYISEEDLDRNRHKILEARQRGKEKGGTGDREMADELTKHRAEIYKEYVDPLISSGKIVLGNRGEAATLAYQTARGELSMNDVWKMHRKLGVRKPDFVVITVCNPETSIKREEFDRNATATRNEREKGSGLSGKVTAEQGLTKEEEIDRRRAIFGQYLETANFLKERGVNVLVLNTEAFAVDQEVQAVKNFVNR